MKTYQKRLLTFLLLCIFSSQVIPSTAASQKQRILLIISYHPAFPTFFQQISGVRSVFEAHHVELDIEYMDAKRLFDEANEASFYERLSYKQQNLPPYDLILTADDNALNFVLKYQNDLFRDTPVVFLGVNNLELALSQNGSDWVTGVVEAVSMQETLALMVQLTPDVTDMYALVDDTPGGQGDLQRYYAQAEQFPGVTFHDISLTTLSFTELEPVLQNLGPGSVVLLLSAYHDRNGRSLDFAQSLEIITQNLTVPVYHLWYHGMGDGLLGGKLISHEEQGKMAATMALEILHGRSPADLPVITESPNRYVFDYNQLTRFQIPLSDLPPDSLILNQPETFYGRYRNLVWTVSLIIALLLIFIFILAHVNLRRLRTEYQLRESHQQVSDTLTQLTNAQEQLVQHERLAAVGQLSAGIAHDFNNILASILLYTEIVQRSADLPPQIQERLNVVVQQTQRGADLVQQILDFGRRAVIDLQPLNLMPFLKEIVKLMRRTFPENIHISLQGGPSAYTINADLTRLQQVIMNLSLNARNAMPDGGNLSITISRQEGSFPCTCCGQTPMQEWVCIAIADTGVGIPADVQPHIFEPFYTTRAPLGSGLGLAQVHGIVQQHKGHVAFTTEMGQGTTFMTYWPALPMATAVSIPNPTTPLNPGVGQTILIVEDDPAVQTVLLDVLHSLNYQPLVASNGQQALQLLATTQNIALILSDQIMPIMGGIELATTLQTCTAAPPLIIMSGHPLTQHSHNGNLPNVIAWLSKPLNLDILAETIASALLHPSPINQQ